MSRRTRRSRRTSTTFARQFIAIAALLLLMLAVLGVVFRFVLVELLLDEKCAALGPDHAAFAGHGARHNGSG